ncbi:MAG: translation initiation factor IF-3 [Candidatus Nasuia deltocephalinicola]
MKKGDFKFNKFITFKIVKLFNSDSKCLGIFKLGDCLKTSKSINLDIIELRTSRGISFCNLDNYKNFKYLESKKKKIIENKKKNIKKTKEIKLHLFTSDNDYNHKFKFIKNFLLKNFKVKISLIIKGREVVKSFLINEKIKKIVSDVKNYGFLTNSPDISKKNIFLYFSPRSIPSNH